jgi:hypothetical protein
VFDDRHEGFGPQMPSEEEMEILAVISLYTAYTQHMLDFLKEVNYTRTQMEESALIGCPPAVEQHPSIEEIFQETMLAYTTQFQEMIVKGLYLRLRYMEWSRETRARIMSCDKEDCKDRTDPELPQSIRELDEAISEIRTFLAEENKLKDSDEAIRGLLDDLDLDF